MLVGTAGTGKSVLVGAKLAGLDPEDYLVKNVPFNYYTTSAMLQGKAPWVPWGWEVCPGRTRAEYPGKCSTLLPLCPRMHFLCQTPFAPPFLLLPHTSVHISSTLSAAFCSFEMYRDGCVAQQ